MLLCFFHIFVLHAQSDTAFKKSIISNTDNFKIDWILNGCILCKGTNNQYFRQDSFLNNFYQTVEEKRRFLPKNIDTFTYLTELLIRAKGNQHHACLLPFIRMHDKDANAIYNRSCGVYSYRTPNRTYCQESSIQQLVLFAIHFQLVAPLKLGRHRSFEKIQLQKNDTFIYDKEYSQSDFDTLFTHYQKWLVEKFVNRNNNIASPLEHTHFKWFVETSPRISRKNRKLLDYRQGRRHRLFAKK